MRIAIAEPAQGDLVEAVAYYDHHGGLGADFLEEFEHCVDRILKYPLAWAAVSPRFRQCRLNRFPYGVLYEILQDAVRVVAVAHLQREPGWWQRRLDRENEA
jgi:hypothetical protein